MKTASEIAKGIVGTWGQNPQYLVSAIEAAIEADRVEWLVAGEAVATGELIKNAIVELARAVEHVGVGGFPDEELRLSAKEILRILETVDLVATTPSATPSAKPVGA